MDRRRAKTVLAALAGLLVVAWLVPAAVSAAQTGPPAAQRAHGKHKHLRQRPSYWGAWIGNQLTGGQPPWDMSSVSRFEELAHKSPSILAFASPFADCSSSPCDFYSFPAHEMETLRAYGAIPMFNWGSQSTPVPNDLNEPDFQLGDIAAGAYDGYITEFARQAAAWGHQFFLRFNWEMNGNWFPWAEAANGNGPGDYIRAWRHVHDIFTAVGATNATWVWCPYADPKHRLPPLKKFYPGNRYVDWTCLDVFNWTPSSVNPQKWRSFDDIVGPSYRTIVRRIARNKPMMLGETGSGGRAHAKATWISNMFKDLRTKYRRVRALVWFEQVDRGVQWPIESAPSVSRAFSRGVGQRSFKRNIFSATAGGPVRPPR